MESLSICFAAIWGSLAACSSTLRRVASMGFASPWSLLTLAALLGAGPPILPHVSSDYQSPVAAYQFWPVRVVCMCFFWFAGVYFQHKTLGKMLIGYAAAGLSFLWNLETGISVLVAWGATLAFDAVAAGGVSLWRARRPPPCTASTSCSACRYRLPATHCSPGSVRGNGPIWNWRTSISKSSMAPASSCCPCRFGMSGNR